MFRKLVVLSSLALAGCMNLLIPPPLGKVVVMQVKSVVPCIDEPRTVAQINKSTVVENRISDETCKRSMYYSLSDLPLTAGGRMFTLVYLLTGAVGPEGAAQEGDLVRVSIAGYTPDRTLLVDGNKILSVVCKASDEPCKNATTLGPEQ